MKIINQNGISFKSKPIQKINIINTKDKNLVPAVISRLNPNDGVDQEAIQEIKKNWQGVSSTLMDSFVDGFTKDAPKTEQYNALELINGEKLSSRIVGITKYFKDKNPYLLTAPEKIYLNVLITDPKYAHAAADRKLKNIGEALFGEVFKYAKKAKSELINFKSEDDEFYFRTLENSGIKARDNQDIFYLNSHEFTIDKTLFDQYLDYWKKKFKINFLEKAQ